MSLLVGAFSSVVYLVVSRLMRIIKVDDPLDVASVHCACGSWGVVAVGLFSSERLQAIAGLNYTHYGLAYGGGGRLLLCQLIGIASIGGLVSVMMSSLFLFLRTAGILRVSAVQEHAGIDELYHGGAAYPEDQRPWDAIQLESLSEEASAAESNAVGTRDRSVPREFHSSGQMSGEMSSLKADAQRGEPRFTTNPSLMSTSGGDPRSVPGVAHASAASRTELGVPGLLRSRSDVSEDVPSKVVVLHGDVSIAW